MLWLQFQFTPHCIAFSRTGLVAARGAGIRFFAVARARVEVDATVVLAKTVAARTESVVAIGPRTVFASLAGLEGFFSIDSETVWSGWKIIADEGRAAVSSAIRIESATNPLCLCIHHLVNISAEPSSALISINVPVFFHPVVNSLCLIASVEPTIIYANFTGPIGSSPILSRHDLIYPTRVYTP